MSNVNNNKENSGSAARTNIMPDPDRVTNFMRKSLDQLQSSLICPLCNDMLRSPSTLGCAHTFCRECIQSYSCKNTLCPVKGCGIPLSVTGSRKGSFLKINPSLETVISSYQTICQALDQAPKQWWNEGQDIMEEDNTDRNNNSEDDDDGSSSDEEMITLNVSTGHDNKDDAEEDEPYNDNRNWLRDVDLDSDEEGE